MADFSLLTPNQTGMGSYNFLDTDQIIEKATGMTIPEIFDAEGEEGFRQVETQILDSVHSYVRCVVSTGGGLVTKIENWSKLQSGIVVWLDVDPEVIMKRIKGTDRPLLQCDDPLQKLKDLLEERKSKYAQADLTVTVTEDMDAAAVADKFVRGMHDFIDVSFSVLSQLQILNFSFTIVLVLLCGCNRTILLHGNWQSKRRSPKAWIGYNNHKHLLQNTVVYT